MKKIYICSVQELSKKKSIIRWIDEIKDEIIVFFDKNNKIKVFSSICPHFGGELIYDNIEDNLKCMWHGWKFKTSDGTCINNSINSKAKKIKFEINPKPIENYVYKIDNDLIYIVI